MTPVAVAVKDALALADPARNAEPLAVALNCAVADPVPGR